MADFPSVLLSWLCSRTLRLKPSNWIFPFYGIAFHRRLARATPSLGVPQNESPIEKQKQLKGNFCLQVSAEKSAVTA